MGHIQCWPYLAQNSSHFCQWFPPKTGMHLGDLAQCSIVYIRRSQYYGHPPPPLPSADWGSKTSGRHHVGNLWSALMNSSSSGLQMRNIPNHTWRCRGGGLNL